MRMARRRYVQNCDLTDLLEYHNWIIFTWCLLRAHRRFVKVVSQATHFQRDRINVSENPVDPIYPTTLHFNTIDGTARNTVLELGSDWDQWSQKLKTEWRPSACQVVN